MRRRRRHQDDEETRIDITPMLDVVFIMLIFFIVTTSFVREFGLDVTPPDSSATAAVEIDDIIAVRIDARGEVSVDGRPTDLARVRALIESGMAIKPDSTVVIVTSRNADAGVLVTVIDEARSAGARDISLAEDAS